MIRSRSGLEAIVESLPDDVDRIRVLRVIAAHGDSMQLGRLADTLDKPSDLVAKLLVDAAKDGLVLFSEDGLSVSLTPLGQKITQRGVGF